MKTVIIADDDPGIRDVFELILKRAGYNAIVYSSGEVLLRNSFDIPDLFILDKQLSGDRRIRGLQVFEEAGRNKSCAHYYVVGKSAYLRSGHQRRSR